MVEPCQDAVAMKHTCNEDGRYDDDCLACHTERVALMSRARSEASPPPDAPELRERMFARDRFYQRGDEARMRAKETSR